MLSKDVLHGGALLNDKGEKGALSPWTIYTTQHPSSFNTSAARYMRRPGTNNHSVYFGDSSGRIFDLNGSGASGDAGSYEIQTVRKTKPLKAEDGIDLERGALRRCEVNYWRVGEVDFSITGEFADELSDNSAGMTLGGPISSTTSVYFGGSNYFGGAIYFGQGALYAGLLAMQTFSLVGRGSSCAITFSATSENTFSVDSVNLG